MIYSWQEAPWRELQEGLKKQHHALLLHGQAGIGKRRFGEIFAQSLLCTDPAMEGAPCGKCTGCRWYEQGSHPDFRLVIPDALRVEEDGLESATEETGRAEKKPATQITVAQIRELQDFLSLTAHMSGGRRVVLIHPADAMNIFAANALLKMLEEPPARTVFLLITSDLRRLLPTVISRCRRYPLPGPNGAQALAWLRDQGIAEPMPLLAQAGGAPVAALRLVEDALQDVRRDFLDRLARLADAGGILELAASAQKMTLPTVVRWLSTWCYDLLAMRLAGTLRYHVDYRDRIEALAERLATDRLLRYQDQLTRAARSASHPLNPRLFLEQLLLSYSQAVTTFPPSSHA